MKHFFFVMLMLLPVAAPADNIAVNYTGHYELAGNQPNRIFALDMMQRKSRVQVTFSASLAGDPDARPTGHGHGEVDDEGNLEFSFKDNFANEGVATVQPTQNGYRVELRITKFVDPAPLHFYGVLSLKKTSDVMQKIVAN